MCGSNHFSSKLSLVCLCKVKTRSQSDIPGWCVSFQYVISSFPELCVLTHKLWDVDGLMYCKEWTFLSSGLAGWTDEVNIQQRLNADTTSPHRSSLLPKKSFLNAETQLRCQLSAHHGISSDLLAHILLLLSISRALEHQYHPEFLY